MDNERKPVAIDPKAAMGLLTHAEFGRVAFIADGLPTIRPLNHAVYEGRILVHTRHSSVFADAVRAQPGLEVAYQADEIKPHSRLGWSVLVAGTAVDVTGERGAEQLGKRVQSWLDRPLDTVIAIRPRKVTGLRLTIGD